MAKDFRGRNLTAIFLQILKAVAPPGRLLVLSSKIWHIPTLIKLIRLLPQREVPAKVSGSIRDYERIENDPNVRDGVRSGALGTASH